ncbi:diacylglycerol kinase [Immundisolibacter sp.]|uniref:diacylglycerol kinase n=1 Tax=Immundisolibacter sp. TaxID=1934948 RepID=UPI0026233E37|nr:diacylglycerol kinase [Immundisolibacter sp.]MDD3649976.1 diacylglycerol kinase [Immundisolibacter sp.]
MGLGRIARAAGYSFNGLRAAFAGEEAFRQELLIVAILSPLGWWLGRSAVERALLIASLLLLLIVELLNSAIEAAIDRIGPERHELSGRAKDMGSAAVFVALVLTGVVWLSIAAARFVG